MAKSLHIGQLKIYNKLINMLIIQNFFCLIKYWLYRIFFWITHLSFNPNDFLQFSMKSHRKETYDSLENSTSEKRTHAMRSKNTSQREAKIRFYLFSISCISEKGKNDRKKYSFSMSTTTYVNRRLLAHALECLLFFASDDVFIILFLLSYYIL